MRGEYTILYRRVAIRLELPPRARRILALNINESNKIGTTSACAENTFPTRYVDRDTGNYLRVRGEYRLLLIREALKQELPPRARRIPMDRGDGVGGGGTTSACAENTQQLLDRLHALGNYLRVRGEYLRTSVRTRRNRELPPRARRIP